MVCAINGFEDFFSSSNKGSSLYAFWKLIFGASGTNLAIRFDSDRSNFRTLATSLIELFVAIVPKVHMWATLSRPYLSVT